jgi:hypothetical protein
MAQNYILQDDETSYWPIIYYYWPENYPPFIHGLYYTEIHRTDSTLSKIISFRVELITVQDDLSNLLEFDVVLVKIVESDVALDKIGAESVVLSKVVTLITYAELEEIE